jgi:hypothetical protein
MSVSANTVPYLLHGTDTKVCDHLALHHLEEDVDKADGLGLQEHVHLLDHQVLKLRGSKVKNIIYRYWTGRYLFMTYVKVRNYPGSKAWDGGTHKSKLKTMMQSHN